MLALVVLVLPLLAPGAAPCLRCWPDAARYVPYDVRLLLGAAQPGGAPGLEKELSALVLGGRRDPGVGVMERERLEREAGKLFYHLDQIITRHRQDPGRLMKEAKLEKQNFTQRLRAASAAIKQQVCSASCGRPQPFDLAECSTCRRLQAQCREPRVCSGASVILAVGLSLGALLGAGVTVGAVRHFRRRVGSKEAKEGPAAGGTEPPTDPGDQPPTDQEDEPPTDQEDEAPTDPGDGAPTDQENESPTNHGDEPPTDQENEPPTDQGDGAPMDQEEKPPRNPGDQPPANRGDGAPMDQEAGSSVDQGDGAPTEGQHPAPRA